MRGVWRHLLQRGGDDLFHLVQQDRRRRPGRGSSTSPSSRCAANLPRHLLTVAGSTRSSAAACLFVTPSAHASTILARSASAWLVFARRAHRVS